MLLEQETYSCGTTRANRKNWPTEFRKPTVLKLKRGESRKMPHEDVTAVVWQDKSVVLLPGLIIRSHEKEEKAMKKLKLHVLNLS